MMSEWERKKIIDLCLVTDYVANGSFKSLSDNVTYNYEKDYAILLRTTDFTNCFKKSFVYVNKDAYKFLKKSSVLPNDIVICNVGSVGLTFMVPKLETPLTLGPNSILIRPLDNDELSNKYFYYLFISPIGQSLIQSITTGTTQSKFNKTNFRQLDVPIPPLPEQKRIIAKLDQALETIDKAKANVERNLQNAKELFQSELNQLFNTKDKGYEEVKLSELAIDITDGDHMPPPKAEKGVPFITISNINKQTHQIDFTNTFAVSREYYQKLKPKRKPQKNDVLYTVTGSYGIPVIIENDFEFCFQRHIGLIRPNLNILSKWLYYWILSPNAILQANLTASGTAQKTVSLTSLRNFMLPRMSLSEQRIVVEKLNVLSAVINEVKETYEQKIHDIDEFKKSILQKAFSGELRD